MVSGDWLADAVIIRTPRIPISGILFSALKRHSNFLSIYDTLCYSRFPTCRMHTEKVMLSVLEYYGTVLGTVNYTFDAFK